ncbi:CotY/CotZ family spore coat protein [Thalassobacillus hwangdonensis]|uniref:CotY/CotZ family spore coat protein n=1 Tax=Thalassobacillus hwangdonensis TaxID=546108 RepID=A0ABW3L0W5_9BACI
MSCGKRREDCICDVVSDIIDAQDDVVEKHCDTSCETSIQELVSPSTANGGNTTVPFILYCENCKPFIASGVVQTPRGGSGGFAYECVETPVLKAKHFVEGSDCCVKVELLLPVNNGGNQPKPSDKNISDVCRFFPGRSIANFEATGICIIIDLNCFCGITCLPAITPVSPSASNHDKED